MEGDIFGLLPNAYTGLPVPAKYSLGGSATSPLSSSFGQGVRLSNLVNGVEQNVGKDGFYLQVRFDGSSVAVVSR